MESKGVTRAPAMAWLLCFVPLLNIFWLIYYKYTILTELKGYLGDSEINPIMDALIWPLLTCGLYQFYIPFKVGRLIYQAQIKAGVRNATDNGMMFFLFMFLCHFNYFRYQEELNKVWAS